MKDKWHFPLIDPVKHWDLQHYIDHVREECKEFEEEMDPEKRAKECLDILHAAETLVRKYFERQSRFSFNEIKAAIIAKNSKRGYYG